MTLWYLDYENVRSDTCLDGLAKYVKRSDTVIIFYSSVTPTIALRFLHKIESKSAKVRTIPCLNGSPNAMDFQIVMELAANCTSGKPAAHRIVSKDRGYDSPLKMWRQRGYDVALAIPSEQDGSLTVCL